jgi:hypothetical protein
MAIEMGDRVEGTRLPRPGDNSPLSYHAALSALELSHANQIHNSLSAARTLLTPSSRDRRYHYSPPSLLL